MEATVSLKHFDKAIGQATAIKLLSKAIVTHRIPNAFLFAGAEGIGKRLTAKCFIQALFSHALPLEQKLTKQSEISEIEANSHPDVLWVNPTYQHQDKLLTEAEAIARGIKRKVTPIIRIEQVRELVEFATKTPLDAPRKVAVIEDADTLNHQAASALLKTLEEPTNTLFILLVHRIQAILPTIVSRCQVIPFRRLKPEDVATVLIKQEQQSIWENPLLLSIAQGSPGEAIAQYQMMQSIPPELLNQCSTPPTNLLAALSLARTIDNTLEYSQQLWLLDYLQYLWWHSFRRTDLLEKLAKAKNALLKMAQNRLVWEVVLADTI